MQPQVPKEGYAYIEVEIEEAGLACMIGLTTTREIDKHTKACAESWTVSMLDGSLWHKDTEITSSEIISSSSSSTSVVTTKDYKGYSLRETMGGVLRLLNVFQNSKNAKLGFSRGGGRSGDRVGLLVHRSTGTMQVFINGIKHPHKISNIPKQGPLFFMSELLSDEQQIRIVPNANPPSLK